MTTHEVADRLVALCREGKFKEATNELYAHDIVSVEAVAPPNGSREMHGLEAVKGKGEWWEANHEVHSLKVEGPVVAGHHFAVAFLMNVTSKPMGKRFDMHEIALYKIANGKVVHEEFFYHTPSQA